MFFRTGKGRRDKLITTSLNLLVLPLSQALLEKPTNIPLARCHLLKAGVYENKIKAKDKSNPSRN